jgi:hypothetical protein
MGIAAVLVFQASAISMIAFGVFEQAGPGANAINIKIDDSTNMNVFLLIGASVFVLTLIGMAFFYGCNTQHPRSQFAMVLGSVLTVLVGGSATTIALSPTLLAGNAVSMWIGIGVGGFVLLAMLVQASLSCVKFGGDTDSNVMKTGAVVFAVWTGIIAATATGGAMISTSAINGLTLESFSDPVFMIGAGLALVVLTGVIVAASCACCGKEKKWKNLFFL